MACFFWPMMLSFFMGGCASNPPAWDEAWNNGWRHSLTGTPRTDL